MPHACAPMKTESGSGLSEEEENINIPVTNMAHEERPNNFANPMHGKRVGLIHIFVTHPILLRHNSAFVPSFIEFTNIAILYVVYTCERVRNNIEK